MKQSEAERKELSSPPVSVEAEVADTRAKFWLSGLVTFDKSTTPEQRQALGESVGHVFPVKRKSFQIAEAGSGGFSYPGNSPLVPDDISTSSAVVFGDPQSIACLPRMTGAGF